MFEDFDDEELMEHSKEQLVMLASYFGCKALSGLNKLELVTKIRSAIAFSSSNRKQKQTASKPLAESSLLNQVHLEVLNKDDLHKLGKAIDLHGLSALNKPELIIRLIEGRISTKHLNDEQLWSICYKTGIISKSSLISLVAEVHFFKLQIPLMFTCKNVELCEKSKSSCRKTSKWVIWTYTICTKSTSTNNATWEL